MNTRSFALAAVAFVATLPALADAAKRPEPRIEQSPAVRGQTLLEELAAGMRVVLVAVAPEISLPKLELKLPTLDGR